MKKMYVMIFTTLEVSAIVTIHHAYPETPNLHNPVTHQQRENQCHNIDGPCRAKAGEHGETQIVPQRGDLLSFPVLHEVRATVQRGLGVHHRLQLPPRQKKQRGEATEPRHWRVEVEEGEGRHWSSDNRREKSASRETWEGLRGGLVRSLGWRKIQASRQRLI